MHYEGKVYRPPSEARSLILQCTVGCAHNTCAFCSMYKADDFHMRSQKDILQELQDTATYLPNLEKLFLADGDALVLPTERLIEIINLANNNFPRLRQISTYATVQDILHKSLEELKILNEAGLELLYIGLESGSDKVLESIGKDQTQAEYVEACHKAKEAGFRLSITVILGLAEKEGSCEHIRESAKAISLTKPDFVSCLSLYLEEDAPLFDEVKSGKFTMLSDSELMAEMYNFVLQVDSEGSIFRSNHPSNPYSIRGTFNADRRQMLSQIERAVSDKDFRPEIFRGL